MADELSDHISQLLQQLVDARRDIARSKKCAGCTFLDEIIADRPKICGETITIFPHRRMETAIENVQSFLLEAAKCRGLGKPFGFGSNAQNADQPRKWSSSIARFSQTYPSVDSNDHSGDQSNFDQSSQTSPSIDPNRKIQNGDQPISSDRFSQTSPLAGRSKNSDAPSQTSVSSKYFDELEKFFGRVNENDFTSARNLLEEMVKLSATELERQELKSMTQFLKMFLQITDDEFDVCYKNYSLGASMDEIREDWMNVKTIKDKIDEKDDLEFLKGRVKEEQNFQRLYEAERKKVSYLVDNLASSKVVVMQLINFMTKLTKVESASQDKIRRWMSVVSEFTEMLNRRRKLAY